MNKRNKNKITVFGSKQSFCQMRNASEDEVIINIFDEIGGWGIWASEFVAYLSQITAATIRVRIHSPGGWVDEAIAMHAALRQHPALIITEVISIAASAASFLAQAGDKRIIAENARLMIHDLQGGVIGTEDEIRAYADSLPLAREAIIATYAYRTKISADAVREMMMRGTDVYLSAEQAVEMGFADRIEKLADMGEPPNDLPAANSSQPDEINRQKNMNQSVQALSALYGFNTSVGSGQRDQGKQGENMNKAELIAQLKEAGTDVEGLQNQVSTLTQTRDDAVNALTALKAEHDALTAVVGDKTPAQLKAALAASERYTTAMVDSIVAGRRLLNLCGDSDDDVKQARAMLANMSVEQLEAESANMAKATSGLDSSQMTPDGHDDDATGASELDAEVNRVIDLQNKRKAREA